MTEHRADTALRALAELRVPEPLPQVEARQRREIIEHLERMQHEPPRAEPRRRWVWLSAAALVLGALGALVIVLSSSGHEAPRVNFTAKSAVLPPLIAAAGVEQMTTGSEVKTDAGSSVQLRTSLGARISVGGSSELRLAEVQQPGSIERVELAAGSIRVKVPKLGPNRQFRVSTPDTLVIVHGTEFSVTVRNDAHGRPNTVVEVKSGRVEVRKKEAVEFLNAGAAWSSERSREKPVALAPKQLVRDAESTSSKQPNPTPGASTEQEPAALPPPPVASAQPAPEPVEGAPPGGSLVRANALLRSALEASRKGNEQLALGRLDELLRRYPGSPVADNARVERFRVLKRLGREREAARAASGYLEGDPDGFARDEARTLGK